jgi:Ca2+-binding EF-hand superfamily protein
MQARKKFQQYDTDQSGSIDRDELTGLLQALHLEKYIPKVEEIEEAKKGPGIREPKPPEEVAPLPSADEPIAEGSVKQYMAKSGIADKLFGMVKAGVGAIASSEIPTVGNKKQLQDPRIWVDRNFKLYKSSLQWGSGSEQGEVQLMDIKRVTDSDIGDPQGLAAFEIGLRTLVDGQPVVYVFAAPAEDEGQEWMDVIKTTILQQVPQQVAKTAKTTAAGTATRKSDEQVKEECRKAFALFDVSGNGSLEAAELDGIASHLGKQLTPAERADAFKELDEDGNGMINYEEFESWWLTKFSGELVEGTKLAALIAQVADARQISGVCYHPDRYVDPDDEMRARCWGVFEEIDSNHDNFISFIEFVGWWKRKDKEEHHGQSTISDETLQKAQKQFTGYDSNSNGGIDRDELAGLLRGLDLLKYVPTADELEQRELPMYKVDLHTGGDHRGGCDASVFVNLYGEDGDTGKQVIKTATSPPLGRGQIRTFKVRCEDVGEINRVTVGHDNQGAEMNDWLLDKLVVTKVGAGDLNDDGELEVTKVSGADPVECGCYQWFDAKQGDGKFVRTLTPGDNKPKTTAKPNEDIEVLNPMSDSFEMDDDEVEISEGSQTKSTAQLKSTDLDMNPERKVIIEFADGLRNADTIFGGKSDPYAVVSWNGKLLGKTKIIDNTLHPIWNQDFDFYMEDEGLLKVQVFDHDVFFSDTHLGTVDLKLGGLSNPRGLLKQQEYYFSDPTTDTGTISIRVEHGSHRFNTEDQHMLRERFMKGGTMRALRQKHVFASWTRIYIMAVTMVMTIVGCGMCYFASMLFSCSVAPFVAYGFAGLGGVLVLTSLLGFYGAFRVKGDILKEEESSEGGEFSGAEDDGLQTPGQRVLTVYFLCSMVVIVFWLFLIIETVFTGMAGGSGDCHADYDDNIMNLCMGVAAAIALLIFGLYCVVKIVSFFEIMQSVTEGVNAILMLMGIIIMLIAAVAIKQLLCLTPPDNYDQQKPLFVKCGALMTYGFLIVAVSFYGFVAAFHESMNHLFKHALALGFLTFVGVVLAVIVLVEGIDSVVTDNCEELLNFLPETFFEDFAACSKYKGYAERWNGTGWLTANTGESAYCSPKSLTKYVWEHNQGGNPNYYGCLNTGCCDKILDQLHQFDYGLVVIFLLTFGLMFLGIYGSLYLRRETNTIGHVLLHPYAKRIYLGMKLTVLVACIAIPFIFTGDNCGAIESDKLEAQMNVQSSLSVTSTATAVQPSCFNGILDGKETDIDCGGSCVKHCKLSRGCNLEKDCGTGLTCTAYQPKSDSQCFDARCVPGQAALGLKGICSLQNTPDKTCADSTVNFRETDVDCGGPDCRGLSPPKLCGHNKQCKSEKDCVSTSPHCIGTAGSQFGTCQRHCNFELFSMTPSISSNCGGKSCAACSDGGRCSKDDDCRTGLCYRPGNNCTASTCVCISHQNGRRDGPETDTDCGGTAPQKCRINQKCIKDIDCFAGKCDTGNQTCQYRPPADTCKDGTKNGLETDLDCGGRGCRSVSKLCADTKGCKLSGDCIGGSCFANVCFSCNNSKLDGDETSVDCGGNSCAKCADTQTCKGGRDCISSNCHNSICVSFSNKVKDGGETDKDCGGTASIKAHKFCGIGQNCAKGFDCRTTSCKGGKCKSTTPLALCTDGIMGGQETDLDCGGPTCTSVGRTCNETKQCRTGSDCTSGICGPGLRGSKSTVCASCLNKIVDGSETDTDCGGKSCKACGDGASCLKHNDCTSGSCYVNSITRSMRCVSCFNKVKDGQETDVDCGGKCISKCQIDKKCQVHSDCTTGSCNPKTYRCRAQTAKEQCSSGDKNGDETDVDCGGKLCQSISKLCKHQKRCAEDKDCLGGLCFFSLSATSVKSKVGACVSCSNSIKDGSETDIDCGGPCNGCKDGRVCAKGTDCTSKSCHNNTCVSAFNGKKDGDETCVDGGGYAATKHGRTCKVGDTCGLDRDCATNVCNTTAAVCRALTPQETCSNKKIDGVESDQDCGGAACRSVQKMCAVGKKCVVNADCTSTMCFRMSPSDKTGSCVSCANGVKDGDETDADCGGSCSKKCSDGKVCKMKGDCINDCFQPTVGNPVCVSAFNGKKDGDETCADGGGTAATLHSRTCKIGDPCKVSKDCHTGVCRNLKCVAQTPSMTCNNNKMDGLETALDCGGAACRTVSKLCAVAKACVQPSDCMSGLCFKSKCFSCANNVTDGDETDMDCGGSACRSCADTKVCRNHTDCSSKDCYMGSKPYRCVGAFNGIKDGDETCVDGGGTAASKHSQTCKVGEVCRVDNDCATGVCSKQKLCRKLTAKETCSNKVRDGVETDLDCGGQSCQSVGKLCKSGQQCKANLDCTSTLCHQNKCVSCKNQLVDGLETDVDCGGIACGKCADAARCVVSKDCKSGLCSMDSATSGRCASCSNAKQDGKETGQDCGGLECPRCSVGQGCSQDRDCQTSKCDSTTKKCRPVTASDTCKDSKKSGNETDIDCGGACSAFGKLCGDGKQCKSGADCASNLCVGAVCVSCSNKRQDGDETAVDCGGSCHGCKDGDACKTKTDCSSSQCINKKCVSCSNGIKDGWESDVDCGPPGCAKLCRNGQECTSQSVCASQNCDTSNATNFVCAPPKPDVTCADGRKGQFETARDCGGVECRSLGKLCPSFAVDPTRATCKVNLDCTSGICYGPQGSGLCVACTDKARNGDETDRDCGGATCAACADGLKCKLPKDCSSGSCEGGVCVSCRNGKRDGKETDVDCGGSCAQRCGISKRCVSNVDCASSNCGNQNGTKTCLAPLPSKTCKDSKKGELETCIDGGGLACSSLGIYCTTCAKNSKRCSCKIGQDCDSGQCFAGKCFACKNSVRDGDETDADCGGKHCSSCADGMKCTSGSDCISSNCAASTCVSCSNQKRDGTETDTDCGGACTRKCTNGKVCKSNGDCASGNCDSATSKCAQPSPSVTCADGKKGGFETCTDGGGVECASLGKLCATCLADPKRCTCVKSTDCASGQCHNVTKKCFSCTNTQRDGDETDIDCGGSACAACADAKKCSVNRDCISGACTGNICVSCSNNRKDGRETDVDCGGVCAKRCRVNQACTSNSDCTSGNCAAGKCDPPLPSVTCSDKKLAQMETCIDGGGAQCRALGKLCATCKANAARCDCALNADCTSGLCFQKKCFSCANQVKDGSETGPDCGGGSCPSCKDGGGCTKSSDCTSHKCVAGKCVSCSNGIRDGLESDVDCGGDCNSKCAIGATCKKAGDCKSANCDGSSKKCAKPLPSVTCSDKQTGQFETDVDCGGAECVLLGKACSDGKTCGLNRDCVSGSCHAKVCVSCTNGLKDGQESDLDCGGSTCSKCKDTKACASKTDCASDVCYKTKCVSYTNSKQDGDETDIDCGGSAPNKCSIGKKCLVAGDCASGNCDKSVCKLPSPTVTCRDGKKNNLETCTDGGGAECVSVSRLCATGQPCKKDEDCTGGKCAITTGNSFGRCHSCKDGIKNGFETDVDCGGGCNVCALGKSCKVDADCHALLMCYRGTQCIKPGKMSIRAASGNITAAPGATVRNSLWLDMTKVKTSANAGSTCTSVSVITCASFEGFCHRFAAGHGLTQQCFALFRSQYAHRHPTVPPSFSRS